MKTQPLFFALALSPFFLPSEVKERIMFTFTQPQHSDQIAVGGMKIDTSTSARLPFKFTTDNY